MRFNYRRDAPSKRGASQGPEREDGKDVAFGRCAVDGDADARMELAEVVRGGDEGCHVDATPNCQRAAAPFRAAWLGLTIRGTPAWCRSPWTCTTLTVRWGCCGSAEQRKTHAQGLRPLKIIGELDEAFRKFNGAAVI